MPKGTTIPKGRLTWPREAKSQSEERVLVFAEGRQAEDAKQAGAHIVGGLELVDDVSFLLASPCPYMAHISDASKIINGRHNPTTILCVPNLLRSISPKLGKLLGPRGLMPSERRGTVTEDVAGYIRKMQGSVEWKGDKDGTIRTPIAKVVDQSTRVGYHLITLIRSPGHQKISLKTSAIS